MSLFRKKQGAHSSAVGGAHARKPGKKKKLAIIIYILIFAIGLGLLLYPTVSNYWNKFHATQSVANYDKVIDSMDEEEKQDMWDAAVEYNKNLAKNGQDTELSEFEKERYESLLDIDGTGMMGYVEIPNIDVTLPIYHYTEEDKLQIAVGHLEWTSLPTGGKGTHCVISGHRGLPSARLFTDLDQLSEGDCFVIRTLDKVLTYEIDKISIVLPTETQSLYIEDGKDLCTLVTCTPYGVNSHRLLIRGHRVANQTEALIASSDAMQIQPLVVAACVAVPLLVIAFAILYVYDKRSRRKECGIEGSPDFGEDDDDDEENTASSSTSANVAASSSLTRKSNPKVK